jgi:hypothetical protein
MSNSGCDGNRLDAVSNSGVKKMDVTVTTNPDGNTVEQGNYAERLRRDNLPGSIKHLYVISEASGQVLIYSTVKGKVTSSGKRLTPSTVHGNSSGKGISSNNYNWVTINGKSYLTDEVMGDDGMYGGSVEYIYWFDSKDVYHQHYKGGNEMLHISDQPLAVKSIILNLESL